MKRLRPVKAPWTRMRFSVSLAILVMLLLITKFTSLPRAGAGRQGDPEVSRNGSIQFVDSGQTLGNQTSSDVALGDFDGDGDLDAFVTNAGSGTPDTVWINQGGNQGSAEGVYLDSGQELGTLSSMAVALSDLDGDTDLDAFVVAASNGDSNQVWINQSVATGIFKQTTQIFGDSLSTGVALGPLNAGSAPDAFVGRATGRSSKVWLNDGGGTFSDSGQSLDTDSSDVALGDLDGDDDLDAFSANGSNNKVWINQGGSQTGTPGVFLDSGQVLTSGLSLALDLGDLDGDGDLDAYVANSLADKVWVNQGGDQGGTEGVFLDSGQSLSAGQSRDVALGDLDGDGDLDAFVAKGAANEVWVNQGGDQGGTEGVFLDSGLRLGSAFSDGVALGDVDGDDDLDAFVANWPGPNKVWLNQSPIVTPIQEGWQWQTVDSYGSAGFFSSIVIDDNGFPHISYVRSTNFSFLIYTRWDGVRWNSENVDTRNEFGGVNQRSYTSLALDSNGNPHIAYTVRPSAEVSELYYAHFDGLQWVIRNVDPTLGFDGGHVSLALDSNDMPHISFRHAGDLRYAHQNGAVWIIETVDDDTGDYNSLALDANNNPHISYYESQILQHYRVKYAHNDGSGWQTAVVDDGPSDEPFTSLALDGSGDPHISYNWNDGHDLRYASLNGTGWEVQAVISNTLDMNLAGKTSLALDSLENPHIVYRQWYSSTKTSSLEYVFWDGAAWQFETLDNSGDAAAISAMALDQDDNIHVSYRKGQYNDLNHVTWAPKWRIQSVGDPGTVLDPSITVLQARPHIAYYNQTGGVVKLASWEDPWNLNPVDFVANPVPDTSVATGFSWEHVSYYDADNQQLMYGRWNGLSWNTQVVDDVGDIGRYNDIVLVGNSDALVRIAYWDSTNRQVKLARIDGSRAPMTYTNTAGPSLNAGSGYVSAGVLAEAHIGISYYDGVNGNLRLASWNPQTGDWVDRLVDGILADVGRLNALQVDGTEGIPVFAYYDETNDAIKFAYEEDGAFKLEVAVPAAGGVTSLSLDLVLEARQHAKIAYTSGTDGSLRIAALKGGIWTIEIVDTGAGSTLSDVSLALGVRPHLAYSDSANSLRYAARSSTLQIDRNQPGSPPGNPYLNYNLFHICRNIRQQLGDNRDRLNLSLFTQRLSLLQTQTERLNDLAIFNGMMTVFNGSPGGQFYIDLYLDHGAEMGRIGLTDPALLWDGYGTLQNFLPGLEALVTGRGREFLVTQQMVDDALDIWQRLAAAGSPELASTINAELAKYNNLQDFVGLSFDEWALELGVVPPSNDLYMPIVTR